MKTSNSQSNSQSQTEHCAFSHILLNVTDINASKKFYLKALKPLGFQEADFEEQEYSRITNGSSLVIVLSPTQEKYKHFAYHRKGTGLGHIAISVSSNSKVDEMEAHLQSLKIPLLGEGKTELGYRRGYYCLLFEDPDRIMIEIVSHDPYYFSYDKNC